MGVLTTAAKRRRRPALRAASELEIEAAAVKTPSFLKFRAKPLTKSSKFRGYPNPKVKNAKFLVVKEATATYPNH